MQIEFFPHQIKGGFDKIDLGFASTDLNGGEKSGDASRISETVAGSRMGSPQRRPDLAGREAVATRRSDGSGGPKTQ